MRSLLPLLLALSLSACSSLSTSFDYDTSADFSGLKSYSWIEPDSISTEDSLAIKRVRAAVTEVLATKGYRVDDAAPDFLVAAHLGSKERLQVTDWGYSYGRYDGWYGSRDVQVYSYDEGSLILDVVGASERELLWRGTASRVVDPAWTPEKREQVIREAVEALLERFPPDGGA